MESALLALPETVTFDDWRDLGRRLCASARQLSWLIGDWLIDGSQRFGDKARDEAQAIFRSDVDRLGPIVDTCRRFPEAERHKALTFGHHLVVAKVQPEQAHQLLDKAERDRLTVAAFKAEVRVATDRQSSTLPDDDPEDAAYRIVIQGSNRCGSPEARRLAVEAIIAAGYGVVDL